MTAGLSGAGGLVVFDKLKANRAQQTTRGSLTALPVNSLDNKTDLVLLEDTQVFIKERKGVHAASCLQHSLNRTNQTVAFQIKEHLSKQVAAGCLCSQLLMLRTVYFQASLKHGNQKCIIQNYIHVATKEKLEKIS